MKVGNEKQGALVYVLLEHLPEPIRKKKRKPLAEPKRFLGGTWSELHRRQSPEEHKRSTKQKNKQLIRILIKTLQKEKQIL